MDEPQRWWELPPGTPTAAVAAAFSRYLLWRVDEQQRIRREIERRVRARSRPYTIHPITGSKTWI